jgi:hypothetical protein
MLIAGQVVLGDEDLLSGCFTHKATTKWIIWSRHQLYAMSGYWSMLILELTDTPFLVREYERA